VDAEARLPGGLLEDRCVQLRVVEAGRGTHLRSQAGCHSHV
jgi:hypothetical protein